MAGRQLSTIHINDIAHALERIERNSDRKNHMQRRPVGLIAKEPQQIKHIILEEIRIFKKAENPQIRRDTKDQINPSMHSIVRQIQPEAGEIIDCCRKKNQSNKCRIPPHVKNVTGNQ